MKTSLIVGLVAALGLMLASSTASAGGIGFSGGQVYLSGGDDKVRAGISYHFGGYSHKPYYSHSYKYRSLRPAYGGHDYRHSYNRHYYGKHRYYRNHYNRGYRQSGFGIRSYRSYHSPYSSPYYIRPGCP